MIRQGIQLVKKFNIECREKGMTQAIGKTTSYMKKRKERKNRKYHEFKDVLFVNGCTLEHPMRYRVHHQIEQLHFNGFSCDWIFYEGVSKEMVKYYRTIVFYRCPYTHEVGEMIAEAKKHNKVTFFDIDDLVIDEKYTSQIKYLENLTKEQYAEYIDGVNRMQKTLRLCDHAITSTEALKEELKDYIQGEVFVNRNVASQEMVKYSQVAIKEHKQEEKDKVVLGYFSGSITHNDDFNMILPVVKDILLRYKNVYLVVVGLLDIPEELECVKEQILCKEFVDWRKLPYLIRDVDINICPLIDTVFNRAKSENKWVEASLVQVPTIASNVGALKDCITDEVNGVLCSDLNEWKEKLENLINNPEFRKKIAMTAYHHVMKNNLTAYSGLKLERFIQSKANKNIVFVLPSTNISGGVNVIMKHCLILKKEGYDVTILNMHESDKNVVFCGEEINVISIHNAHIHAYMHYAVATLWSTLDFINTYYKIGKKMYLVQNFEADFYEHDHPFKKLANLTYNSYYNLEYLTISKWCEDWLKNEYEKECRFAPNGIDLSIFKPQERNFNEKIRILIEGNCDDYYKNVDESFRITNELDRDKFEICYLSYQGKPKSWYKVDQFYNKVPYEDVAKIYQSCHILIKSSILESFSYPPLEMMATGGIVVVVPNEGNIEYLRDRENCLMYDAGDIEMARKLIEEVCGDKILREKLVKNGINTSISREWDNIKDQIVELYK